MDEKKQEKENNKNDGDDREGSERRQKRKIYINSMRGGAKNTRARATLQWFF